MYHNGNCEFTWFMFPMDPHQFIERRAAWLFIWGADQREQSCLARQEIVGKTFSSLSGVAISVFGKPRLAMGNRQIPERARDDSGK